jgi:hypothetical protein
VGAPFEGRCPALEDNDGTCPEIPDHLNDAEYLAGGSLLLPTLMAPGPPVGPRSLDVASFPLVAFTVLTPSGITIDIKAMLGCPVSTT